ncbi:MAG: potassium-transporting ATPase subunit KdpB [Rickettsiales bacterium]
MSSHQTDWKKNITASVMQAFIKLAPIAQLRNPVMLVVYIGAIIITGLYVNYLITGEEINGEPHWFTLLVAVWLWLTIIFSNFAESLAEYRGKAQAETLRSLRKEVRAKKIKNINSYNKYEIISASSLQKDDLVFVEAGDTIPSDGNIVLGIASVDESAITGESAPVIREAGGDCSSATGGTRVLSDWIVVRITANSGESFIERMVSLVEGAKRQKTPNEISLTVFLSAITISYLITITTLLPFSVYSVEQSGSGQIVSLTVLIALLICLAPTTIGGLLSTVGISGMNRLLKANVIASSGRAVEAAGDVTRLLLDKTGTITFGNRQAEELLPASGVTIEQLAKAAYLSSIADQTPEGRSILFLSREKCETVEDLAENCEFIDFSAETRISGIKIGERHILKGALDSIEKYLEKHNKKITDDLRYKVDNIARRGGTPLVVINEDKALGVVHLKDVIKPDIKNRLADLRKMGIKSIMITGDNKLTAAAIAAEAGVDDYMAQTTPEQKLQLIRRMQANGELVAMVGDGTNDAPALAQSDVAVVMNNGTQSAKEAANMIDLDSDPTKLIEIVEIGKQLLMTRGALTTLSIANDVAKYVALIPAAFISTYPQLEILNIMHLTSPISAVLSAIIFNAIIIILLTPLSLRGVRYKRVDAAKLLRHNLLIYGLGGLFMPFAGIKIIDIILTMIGLV